MKFPPGDHYTSTEVAALLGISRQRLHKISARHGWHPSIILPAEGYYTAAQVEEMKTVHAQHMKPGRPRKDQTK